MRYLLLILFLFNYCDAKIYDCFMFDNELEVLEIRLEEMGPFVDYFVLVEWDRSHRKGELKPYHFEENKEKFAKYLHKIIHIKLDEVMETHDGWFRENWHRNQIMRGLKECQPHDIIIISDADEIIPGSFIPRLHKELMHYPMVGFWQKLYQWFLNRDSGQVWSGTFCIKYKHLATTTPQVLRNAFRTDATLPRFRRGWHFSSMGGYAKAREKYYNVVEGYDQWFTEEEWYEQVRNQWKLVPIDKTYPEWIKNNIDYLINTNLIDIP